MNKEELQAELEKLKAEVTATEFEEQIIPRKDSRKLAQIMRIQTKLQAMGEDN